jgi:pectin methylesterase-like acyl-CoA thioesterase
MISKICLLSAIFITGLSTNVFAKDSTGHLVQFNAADTTWNNPVVIKGSASSGGKEGYLIWNKKIDLEKDQVSVEAKVNFSSLSGHVGLGFISINGSSRKGYTLLTGQNVKNTGTTNGAGGQGLENKAPGFAWTVNTDYILKAFLADGVVNYQVFAADGVTKLADKMGTSSTKYHSTEDVVYIALGGTAALNASYSDIKISINGKNYAIDGLDPQSALPSLSLGKSIVRMESTETVVVPFTATAAGGASAPVSVVLGNDEAVKVSVTDNGILVSPNSCTMGTEITVVNADAPHLSAKFTVVVADYPKENSYGTLNNKKTVYPLAKAKNVYMDGDIRLTFDNPPTLASGGYVAIYEADSGKIADIITMSDESQTPYEGANVKVQDQMVTVDGNNVFITPHFGVLKPKTTYFIAIPEGFITNTTLNGVAFTGFSNNKDAANSWIFTTKSAEKIRKTIKVDSSESSRSDFRTIYGALAAIGNKEGDYTIKLAEGTYRELIHFKGVANITIEGPAKNNRGDNCVIQYTNINAWNGSTSLRPVFFFQAGNLVLKNLTIKNTCIRGVSTKTADTQAETIYFKNDTGTFAAYNCSFKSHQDTILTSGRNWFYNCYIEGDTDFIWGTASACLVENSDLVCLNDPNKDVDESILFVARTGITGQPTIGKGYVLLNSKVSVEDNMMIYLGRDAGTGSFYDQVAVLNTTFSLGKDALIAPRLWGGNTSNPSYLCIKEDTLNVGWKDYGLTYPDGSAVDTKGRLTNTNEIPEELFNTEFNGRNTILNRVYNITEKKYENNSSLWDLSKLVKDFKAVADPSAK